MNHEPPRVAYADESFHEADSGGFYVLAAAVFDGDPDNARETIRTIHGSHRTYKSHWTKMDAHRRKLVAAEVADLCGVYLVAMGAPCPRGRQERARAKCLHALVPELHGYGVEVLCCEARTPALDQRDVRTVIDARFALVKGSRFEVRHVLGHQEPLLWVADVVAGAVRARLHGAEEYYEIIKASVYEIEVATGC
ncbi:DUF3800 domain-containing protein [Marinactinospora rubrisoli]|uniref:DUF3800 domain-containing protein n=1 Tax=Marinactinospora rubrisoli TaxID=2715399 RepID=A0ABW2KC17_9ACTN